MVTWSLQRMAFEWLWEQDGDLTVADVLAMVEDMLTSYYDGGDTCMIGTLCVYFTTNPPAGVLPLDGATYDRVDYPILYSVLDAQYLTDEDTFTLPDFSGRTLLGSGSGDGLSERLLGDFGGSETVTLDIGEMPSHTHVYADPGLPELPVVTPGEAVANIFAGAANTSSAGGDQAHENMPPFGVVHFGIWAE